MEGSGPGLMGLIRLSGGHPSFSATKFLQQNPSCLPLATSAPRACKSAVNLMLFKELFREAQRMMNVESITSEALGLRGAV